MDAKPKFCKVIKPVHAIRAKVRVDWLSLLITTYHYLT